MLSQPPWLRGPIPGIPGLLQPVAHALVDADEDTQKALANMTGAQLNRRPVGGAAASAAYHVRHAMGSLDRLFTYARGESLSAEQLAVLAAEKTIHERTFEPAQLAAEFGAAIRRAHAQLRDTRVGAVDGAAGRACQAPVEHVRPAGARRRT